MSEAETLFGDAHVQRYRETDGEVGHIWRRGATTTPLIYAEADGVFVVVASKGGAPTDPGWYRNLAKNPDVQVQIKGDAFSARARTATGAERDRLWELATRQWPDYDEYQRRTERQIPVVVLERT